MLTNDFNLFWILQLSCTSFTSFTWSSRNINLEITLQIRASLALYKGSGIVITVWFINQAYANTTSNTKVQWLCIWENRWKGTHVAFIMKLPLCKVTKAFWVINGARRRHWHNISVAYKVTFEMQKWIILVVDCKKKQFIIHQINCPKLKNA